jgi:hypothetical protein
MVTCPSCGRQVQRHQAGSSCVCGSFIDEALFIGMMGGGGGNVMGDMMEIQGLETGNIAEVVEGELLGGDLF